MGYRLEPATLRHLWPKAPQGKIDSICEISAETFEECGIGDDQRVVAQLMANISHECGAGTIIRESGHYRPERLLEVFGAPHSSAGVKPQEAAALCRDEHALFERVYNLPKSPKLAHELGNHEPGDGYKFRGGGDLQLTGRGSYERIGKMTGHPEIADNPDLIADPKISFKVAAAEFVALGCVGPARRGDTVKVRRLVNGGDNGMAEVKVWLRKWQEALPDIEPAAWAPRASDVGTAKLIDSTIIKGSIGTAAATGVGAVSQVANIAQQASDAVDQAHTTAGNVQHVATAVHPFLGLMPQVWIGLGIASAVVALAALGYIVLDRYRRHRAGLEEG